LYYYHIGIHKKKKQWFQEIYKIIDDTLLLLLKQGQGILQWCVIYLIL
jgi:hypothetical protein